MIAAYNISDFCFIRNRKVVTHDGIQYEAEQGSFAEFITAAYHHFEVNYPKFHKMDNLSKLGFLSVECLLHGKNIGQQYAAGDTGIILMNAASSLDTDRVYQKAIDNRSDYFPSPAVFVYTLPNIVIGEICIRHKLFGEGTFFVKEKFDIDFIYNYIQSLFMSGKTRCCVTGWVDIDREDYQSVLYLIEKSDSANSGIAKFEPYALHNIFAKEI